LLPGRRNKSCYDRDIDPFYTAWGVDIYELFVNTKSDIGTNPNVVDRGAREEYKKLPAAEQESLGFEFKLFQKLQELVRQCDRIVNRNQDKLTQEVNRKLSQRGGQDFVETVDEQAVDRLAMDLFQIEQLQNALQTQYQSLMDVVAQENKKKETLDRILKVNQEKRKLQEKDDAVKEEPDVDDVKVKQEPLDENEEKVPEAGEKRKRDGDSEENNNEVDSNSLHMDLGRLTMQKQQILFDMANTMSRLTPMQEAVEQQHRNLNYVKSDISTDKTVCQVSGNFMSSRDADERIAAHYAGKQYVGWKLVRDKYKEMVQKYGRYGPPPPANLGGSGGGGFNNEGDRRGGGYGRDQGGRGPGRFSDRGGGGGGYPPRGGGYGGDRDRGGGRWERGGGDFHRRGPPPPSRPGWRR